MGDIKLNVKYFSQIGNEEHLFGPDFRQCSLTSHAMALDFLTKGDLSKKSKANGFKEPESYYASKLIKYGDTIDHDAHTACLQNEFGIKSKWCMDLSTKDLEKQLQKDCPVPCGVSWSSSGHIVCVVGINETGFLVHDPYGIRNLNGSYAVGADGSYDLYSFGFWKSIWLDNLTSLNSGWGRIFL